MAELQIFAVLSFDAVSTEAPSAENTAEVMTSSRTASVGRHSPAAELQIFLVLSYDAVSRKVPSAENTCDILETHDLALQPLAATTARHV